MQPLRLAVLSTSRIVDEFLQHLPEMPELCVTALCCRPQSGAKARAWAQQYGIPAVYTDEAACYAAGGFDAVYIGTANHLHYADANKVILLEALTTYYLPQYSFLQAELPKLGPVRGAMASFCARSRRYDDFLNGIWNTTFDPACQGGALNDMNVYNLHLLTGLLGAPQRAEYRASRAENGVDTAGLALLDYGGFTAAALAAKDSEGVNGLVLQGPGGSLHVEGGTNALPTVYSVLGGVRGSGTRTDAPAATRFRMAYEFAEFARIIASHDTAAEAAARARTLAVMDLLDALHGRKG